MTRSCVSLLLLLLVAAPALAQYPVRTVRIMTTSAPGTAPDLVARMVGSALSSGLNQSFVVEIRTGGGGNVASEYVSKATPDGYTLLVAADPVFTANPYLYKKLGFDAVKDLVPVSSLISQSFALCINLSVPAKTLPEFIDYAKRAPKPLFYGTAGAGTSSHLAMEMFKARTGINLVHVPFQGGGGPLMTSLISGDVQATIGGTAVLGQVKAGKLAALATTGPTRSVHYPDLPTFADTVPGYEVLTWMGLFAPAGVPAEVLGRLRPAMSAYLNLAETRAKFAGMGGLDPLVLTLEEFAALIRRDNEKYGKIIRELGVSAE
jgi:tripartite-type tricarboxylate transporter receptor subunit TctC